MATAEGAAATETGNQVVGTVVILYGNAKALSIDGTERVLSPNSPIFSYDRVITESDGMLSIIIDDPAQSQIDIGRMSHIIIDEDIFAGVSAEDVAAAAAEVEQIQEALLAEGFDPTVELEAPAAGASPAAGGGYTVPDFARVTHEGEVVSGAETTGIITDTVDPIDGVVEESPPPTITATINPEGGSAQEGSPVTFEVSINTVSDADTTVTVNVFSDQGDTATAHVDYDASGAPGVETYTVVIPAGETSATFTVDTYGDDLFESSETFSAQIIDATNSDANINVDTAPATGTIIDEDTPTVSISDGTPDPAVEGVDPTISFTVTLSNASDVPVTVDFTTQDGSAEAGSDYTAQAGTLTFAPGVTEQTVTVPVLNNDIFEGDESFTVELADPTVATIDDGSGTGNIDDTPDTPTVSISDGTPDPAVEGVDPTISFTVTLSNASDVPVTVDFTTQDGSAEAGSDYTAQAGTLTFAPGVTEQTVTVPVLNNDIFEGDESFTVELADPTVATIDDGSGTGNIDDTPDTPTVSISDGTPDPAVEGVDPTISFTVTLSNASDVPVTVDFTTQDGSAEAGSDYTAQAGTLTFAPGVTEQTVTVPVLNNDIFEGDESFTVELADPTVATIDDGSGTGNIDDTPDTPTVSISDGTPDPAVEGVDPTISFTVTLSNASDVPVTVDFTTQDGSAEAGSDYTAQAGTLTFAPGVTEQTVTVPVLNNDIFEGDESFTVELADPTVATIDDGSGTGNIDDTPDTPTVSISDGTPDPAVEGVDPTISFTVTLSNASDVPVTVDFTTQDGSAEAGSDYTAQAGTLTFAPGVTEQTVTVPVLNNDIFEGDESFTVELADPTVATIDDGSGTGNIDDTPDTPTVSISDGTPDPAVEGVDPTISFTVTLSNASDVPVTVDFTTQDGSAEAGSDYTAQAGTLTFAPGVTEQTVTVPVLNNDIFEGDESFTVELADPTVATIDDGSGTGNIDDTPDTPTVSISDGTPDPAVEGVDPTISFTVTLSNASDVPVTVDFTTQDGSAEAGSDYTAQAGTLTFAPGVTEQTVTVPVLNNDIFEGDESFTVELADPTVATIDDGSGTGNIDDTPDTPTVSISDGTPDPAVEGVDPTISFTVTLSNASDVPVTVDFTTQDGSAEAGSDYTAQAGTLTFAPGVTEQTVTVPVLNNDIFEGDESFTVELADPTVATIDDGSGTGNIDDTPDTPTVSISDGTPDPAVEGVDPTISFTVTLSNASDVPVTVDFTTQDGSAEAGSDYTAQAGTLTFAPGVTEQTVTVPVLNNDIFEGDESFTVELADPTVATIDDGSGTGNIDDTPDTPTVSISDGTPDPAVEGVDPTISFTVTLSNASDVPVTVDFTTQDGSAEAGSDYTAQAGTLTFAPGVTEQTVTVPVLNNDIFEGDESFTVELADPTVATIDDGSGTGNIDDTPDTPTVSISDGTPDPAVEGVDPTISFTVTLSNASDVPVTVDFTTQDGSAEAGSDYTAQAGTLTFAPGVTEQTVTVPVLNNDIFEGDESFTVELADPTVATIDDGSGTGNIDDTPDTPTVSISDGTPDPAVEGVDPTISFTVTLSNASDVPVTVDFTTQDGSAEAGSDYTAQAGTLTFAPGVTEQTVTVPVLNNDIFEGDESFTVELADPTVATIDDGSGTGNIDDTPDTPTVSISDGTPDPAVEGVDPTISFTVTLSNASDVPVTVDFTTQDGSAEAGSDYTAQAGTLTFAPGVTEQTVTVPVLNNDIFEGDESFTVELADPTVATIDDGSGTGNIDDTPDTPTVSISDGTPDPAVEGVDPTISFTVTLSNASDVPVTVDFTTQDGSAEAGSDYTAQAGTLTFAPGVTEQTVTVPVLNNDIFEGDESFTVELADPTVATIDDGSGTGNIDDTPDTPTVSISDGTPDPAVEGVDPTISFTVTLSNASDVPVTVDFTTQDGSAEAGSDYTAQAGTLTFAPGVTEQTVTVPVLNNDIFEGDESFTVELADPTVATIDDGSGTGNIDDTPDTPTVSISDGTPDPAVEGVDPTISFTVTLSNASDVPVTVDFTTQDGSAEAGSDYTAQAGTLTFAPGVTEQTVTVPVLNNDIFEGDESFTVELADPTVATIDDGSGTGNIDDTPDTPTVSISDGTPDPAVEGVDPTISFTVTLSNASDVPVTVDFTTQDGSAEAGSDYTAQAGTLTFAPGVTEQTVTVPVLNNDIFEGDESFTVELSNAEAATDTPTALTITDYIGDGTIVDDDTIPEVGTSTATVSEEGLPGGNPDSDGSPSDITNSDTFTGTISVTDADGDSLTVTLEDPPVDGSLTSNGVDIIWSGQDTNTLTGTAGTDTVITISIDNNGNYTVDIDGPIDHQTVDVEDVESFNVTVRASDGFQSSTGTLTVDIEDDSPTFTSIDNGIIANEPGILIGTHDIAIGADQPGTLDVTPLTNIEGVNYGIPVYNSDGSVELTAFTISGDFFTLTVRTDGTYDFNLINERPSVQQQFSLLNVTGGGRVESFDLGDATFKAVDFNGDNSIGNEEKLNSTSVGFGVGSGNLDPGEQFEIDFSDGVSVDSLSFHAKHEGSKPFVLQWSTDTGETESVTIVDDGFITIDPHGDFNSIDFEILGGKAKFDNFSYNKLLLAEDESLQFNIQATDADHDTASQTLSITLLGEEPAGTLIEGTSGNDAVKGTSSSETIEGHEGDDYLQGGAGDDTLKGDADNDTLNGGLGNDILNGGLGINTASYEGTITAVDASLMSGQATQGSDTDSLVDIQNLTGGAGNDTLTGNNVDNVLQGGTGDDTLTGGDGADTFKVAEGDDTITDYNQAEGDIVDISDMFEPVDTLSVSENPDGSVKLSVLDGNPDEKGSVSFENIEFASLDSDPGVDLNGDGDMNELDSLLGQVDIDDGII